MAEKIKCPKCGHEIMEMRVCVGKEALRAPNGDYLPTVPLYKIVDASEVNPQTGLTVGEEIALTDVTKLFAGVHRQYVHGNKKAGVKV